MTIYDLWNRLVPLYAPDNGPSGSGGADDSAKNKGNTSDSSADDNADDNDSDEDEDEDEDESEDDGDPEKDDDELNDDSPTASYSRLLKRFNGNTAKLAEFLFRGSYKTRSKLRVALAENGDLKKQIPKNGAYVSRKDAAVFNEYRSLKMTPAQLRERLKDHETLQTTVATQARDTTLRDVADTENAKVSVLRQLGGGLTYEIKEIDGEKRAFVRVKNSDNTVTDRPLREYAEAEWGDFLIALFPSTADTANKQRKFPRQSAPGNTSNGDRKSPSDTKGTTSSYLRSRYPRPDKKQSTDA